MRIRSGRVVLALALLNYEERPTIGKKKILIVDDNSSAT